MNQRELAYQILKESIVDKKYTNLLLRQKLNILPNIQRPFVINLVNGVLRNYDYLNYQYEDLLKDKIKTKNRIILCMALYEKIYMHEKDYVVNNEYVSLVNDFDKGFINAILHNIKEFKEINDIDDKSISIKYSLPLWLIKLLKSQYKEEYLEIISSFKNEAIVYYHLNKNINYDDLKNLDINIINDNVFTSNNYLVDTKEYEKGYFYIQDINSSKIVDYLDLKEGLTLLDGCAGPGGKLFNALRYLNEKDVYANELYEHRLDLIKRNAKRLGFNNINYLNEDARKLNEILDIKFDRILLDVPCSGLGVLKRRPDLRFHMEANNLDELQVLQKEILLSCSKLLKKDGILVYSTCTLNKKENNKQIENFLMNNEEFILLEDNTLLDYSGDYFYVAKIKKV